MSVSSLASTDEFLDLLSHSTPGRAASATEHLRLSEIELSLVDWQRKLEAMEQRLDSISHPAASSSTSSSFSTPSVVDQRSTPEQQQQQLLQLQQDHGKQPVSQRNPTAGAPFPSFSSTIIMENSEQASGKALSSAQKRPFHLNLSALQQQPQTQTASSSLHQNVPQSSSPKVQGTSGSVEPGSPVLAPAFPVDSGQDRKPLKSASSNSLFRTPPPSKVEKMRLIEVTEDEWSLLAEFRKARGDPRPLVAIKQGKTNEPSSPLHKPDSPQFRNDTRYTASKQGVSRGSSSHTQPHSVSHPRREHSPKPARTTPAQPVLSPSPLRKRPSSATRSQAYSTPASVSSQQHDFNEVDHKVAQFRLKKSPVVGSQGSLSDSYSSSIVSGSSRDGSPSSSSFAKRPFTELRHLLHATQSPSNVEWSASLCEGRHSTVVTPDGRRPFAP
eukprot:ANDGO_04609.mRNA.1 hypothetical protein